MRRQNELAEVFSHSTLHLHATSSAELDLRTYSNGRGTGMPVTVVGECCWWNRMDSTPAGVIKQSVLGNVQRNDMNIDKLQTFRGIFTGAGGLPYGIQ